MKPLKSHKNRKGNSQGIESFFLGSILEIYCMTKALAFLSELKDLWKIDEYDLTGFAIKKKIPQPSWDAYTRSGRNTEAFNKNLLKERKFRIAREF